VATSHPGNERATTKAERRARSLANLEKHKIKKGEIRNPTGKNGRERSDYVVSVLEEQDTHGVSHIRKVILKAISRAEHGSDQAIKTVIDHYKGKARLEVDVTSGGKPLAADRKPTTAETRQELDRVLAALDAKEGKTPATAAAVAVAAPVVGEPKATP